MPNPNAFVATVARINAPTEPTPEEVARGLSIEFENERTARLDPADRRSRAYAEMLEEMRRARLPVYIEVNDEGVMTRLLIPLVVKVSDITLGEEADALVELEISHGRHVVSRAGPDYELLLASLREARERGSWVAVIETDDHEIIDVRPYSPPFEPERRAPERRGWLSRFWCWLWRWPCRLFCCIFWCGRCVSAHRAQELFDLVATQTCDPTTVPPPCIPFLYPDDGCWGRASEMCRLMIAAGAAPRKVWIYASYDTSLFVNTRNNPNCHVSWAWHVAPTLCVRVRRRYFFFCRIEERVIDPALFTTPVSEATWKGVQTDPGATLVGSDASIFYRAKNGSTQTDPTYTQTAAVLVTYRQQLRNRSLGPAGPPPYVNCP